MTDDVSRRNFLHLSGVAGLAVAGVAFEAGPAAASQYATDDADSLAAATKYFVSPTGNDAHPGTINKPFRTLQRARDFVRAVNRDMKHDIHVYLRGGVYPVSRTIEFLPCDSGTNGHRIIYASYKNEMAILSGGVLVTGWTRHAGNIWKAPLDRDDKLRALYVNDKRAFMASKTIGSVGGYGTFKVTAGQAPWAWESGTQVDGTKYAMADLPAISRNQEDVEIETATTWTTTIVGVREVTTSSDGKNRVALLQQPGGAIAQGAFNGNFQAGGSHKLMNAYEFLDTPGEFYFDKTDRVLYYCSDSSEDMRTAKVFAPNHVSTVLRLAGASTTSRVRNITFSRLTVEHSDWNLVDVAGSVFKQAQQGNLGAFAYAKKNFHVYSYRNVEVTPGIVELQNAEEIVLEYNRIQHTGVDGINLINDVSSTRLIGNHTNDIAGSAVTVGHPQHVYIGDYTPTNGEKYPTEVEAACKNIEIENNYIYDSAALFKGHSAVSVFFADSLSVQHNRIEKAPWAGVTLGWGWKDFDGSATSVVPGKPTTTAKNNTVSYNQIVDTMQDRNDSAPIYTLGSQPGTIIGNNYAQGVRAGHTYGLHPDEGSAYIEYHDNVLSVDQNVAWVINSGTWGRQHDLKITNTYGPVNKINDKNVPNSVIEDIHVYGDYVWPVPAYCIAVNSGLEDEYRRLIPADHLALPDYVLPASTFVDTNVSEIPVRSTGDAATMIWLAPSGTTHFAVGDSMTKALGTATSIAVPRTPGDYRLYVVTHHGTQRPVESRWLVRRQQGSGAGI